MRSEDYLLNRLEHVVSWSPLAALTFACSYFAPQRDTVTGIHCGKCALCWTSKR